MPYWIGFAVLAVLNCSSIVAFGTLVVIPVSLAYLVGAIVTMERMRRGLRG